VGARTGHTQRPYIRLLDEQSGDLALAVAIPGVVKRKDKPSVGPQKPAGTVSTIAGINPTTTHS